MQEFVSVFTSSAQHAGFSQSRIAEFCGQCGAIVVTYRGWLRYWVKVKVTEVLRVTLSFVKQNMLVVVS